jgi:hypothetical protein
MKTTTKVIFASALMLAAAPTLSHASYFVDQTKTWALEMRAQDVTDQAAAHKKGAAQTQVPGERSSGFYRTGNTSVSGVGVDKDDTTPKSK